MTPIDAARILTLWQPWATLMMPLPLPDPFNCTVHPKGIETRSWATSYRGPVLIHAAARLPEPGLRLGTSGDVTFVEYLVDYADRDGRHDPGDPPGGRPFDPQLLDLCNEARYPLPRGVVLGVADLTDVLPVMECTDHRPHLCTSAGTLLQHTALDSPAAGGTEIDRTTDLPFGDYTDGRYGWIFENARAFAEPIPWKGAQGLRHAPPELLDLVNAALRCPTCAGTGESDWRPSHRIEGGSASCQFCNRTLTFNFIDRPAGGCTCERARDAAKCATCAGTGGRP